MVLTDQPVTVESIKLHSDTTEFIASPNTIFLQTISKKNDHIYVLYETGHSFEKSSYIIKTVNVGDPAPEGRGTSGWWKFLGAVDHPCLPEKTVCVYVRKW